MSNVKKCGQCADAVAVAMKLNFEIFNVVNISLISNFPPIYSKLMPRIVTLNCFLLLRETFHETQVSYTKYVTQKNKSCPKQIIQIKALTAANSEVMLQSCPAGSFKALSPVSWRLK